MSKNHLPVEFAGAALESETIKLNSESCDVAGSASVPPMSQTRLPNTLAGEREALVIQRLQQRDPTALEELYDLYGRLSYSVILRIVHDAGIAEDLVQETFLCVWTRIRLFDSERGTVGAWLLTVARNRALDYLRSSNGRWNSSAGNLAETEDPKLFVDLDRSIFISHQMTTVGEAMRKLNVNQRAVIDLAYFEGYTQTEIAAKLGHPLGTVKTWARIALKILRDELRESPFALGDPV